MKKVRVYETIFFARYIEVPDDTDLQDSEGMRDICDEQIHTWTWDDAVDGDGWCWEEVKE